jgi:hypothetical protein
LCAGCRRPILPGDEILDLADDNRVHLADGYACLIRWGETWRKAARKALGMATIQSAVVSRSVAHSHARETTWGVWLAYGG